MAVDYRGITIEIDGDSSKLSAALGEIREEAKYVWSGLSDVNKQLKFDGDNTTLIQQKMGYLKDVVGSLHDKVDVYRQGLAALDKEAEENGGLTQKQQAQYDQLQRQIISTERQMDAYAQTLASMRTGTDDAAEGTRTLADRLSEVGASLTDAGTSIREVGDAATVGLTVPIVAGAKAAVDAAVDLDTAFHDLTKTASGTDEQMQALKDAAVAMSEVQPVSASELLQIEALGAQLGFATTELNEFGSVASGMDIATDMDAEKASSDMAQFANVTGMAHGEISNYASTIIALGNNMATTESAISGMAQRIAAAGSQVGLSEAEILGLAAALSSVGIEAEAGGSNISKIMSQIDKDVALSSENVETWAEAAGMSAEEFAAAWQTSPIDALQALFGGMQQATQEGTNLSAILEGLGIKSNQMTNVAKSLTSGYETLADGISIATEAWQENTALTEEVANRNESLASQMEILKNRVTNMLAEIGEPVAEALLNILDAASPLFDLLASGAKAFSDLSEGEQQVIVTALALTAAFGPVTSILGRVMEVAGGLSSGLADVVETISLTAMEMSEAGSAGAVLTAGLEGVMGGVAGLVSAAAIPLVITVVGEVVAKFLDWKEHADLVTAATEGLTTAVSESAAALDAAHASMEQHVRTLEEVRDDTEAALQANADFGDTIRDTLGEVGKDQKLVETYANTIKELGNKGSISASDLAELQNAIEQFNTITGASIDITNEATGAYDSTAAGIDRVTEAYERNATAQAYISLYNEAIKRQIENEQELERVNSELTEAEQAFTDAMGFAGEGMQATGPRIAELRQAQDELTRSGEEVAFAVDYYRERMDDAAGGFDSLTDALSAAGVSEEEWAELTEEELEAAAKAFEKTSRTAADAVAVITEAVRKARQQLTSSPSTGSGSSSSGSVTDDPEYKALKKKNEAIYKEEQRHYDEVYRLKSKELDKVYSAQSKAYDKEVTAQSKALDKELDALRESLQEQYDLRKSELDSIYSAQSDAYDKELDALRESLQEQYDLQKTAYANQLSELKASLSAQVEAQKKANSEILKQQRKQHESEEAALAKHNDALYDARKAQYDRDIALQREENSETLALVRKANGQAESELEKANSKLYKERQSEYAKAIKEQSKQNAKVLKQAKAANDAETKAFKAATSERIAAIREEYAIRKQLIEDNDGTKEIDQQIAALNAETEAERAAIKAREREEKLSELRLAVERAKTKRTRQDAEKALADYLEEIAQEEREAERERQIEALEERKAQIKEETSAKQDALDAERDAVISAYEEQRAIALEQMQLAQEEQYEKLSEQLEQELELRREKNSEALEQYREQLDAQETALAESHEREEQALSDSLSKRLESRSEAYEKALERYREMLDAQEDALAESHERQQDALSEQLEAQLDTMREANDATIAEISEQQSRELEAIKKGNSDKVDEQKAANKQALEELAAKHTSELEQISKSNKEKVDAQKEANSEYLSNLRETNSTALSELRETQQEELRQLREKNSDALSDLREKQQEALSDLKKALKEGKDGITTGMDEAADEMGKGADKAGTKLTTGIEGYKTKVNTATTKLFDEAKGVMSKLEEEWKGTGEKSGSSLSTAISGKGTDVERSSKDVYQKAVGAFSDLPEALAGKARTALESYSNSISSNGHQAETSASTIAEGVKSKFDLQSALYQSGYNAGVGLNNGLANAAQQVYNTAQTIANNIVQQMNSALNINSPSKETAAIGRYTVQGLEGGMEAESERLFRNVRDLADGIGELLAPEFDIDALRTSADIYLSEYKTALRAIEDENRRHIDRMRELQAMADTYAHTAQRTAEATGGATTVNAYFGDVTVRSEADIDAIVSRLRTTLRRERAYA